MGEMDKVLIVDDSEHILGLIREVGNAHQDEFELILANSGQKAVEVLQHTPVSLVITDLVMPQIDGLTLLAHINSQYPDTMCVAMTGYATQNVIRMLPDNLVAFLQKPFDIQELVAVIRKGLETRPALGTVRGISVSSFLQLIAMDQKSCALDVALAHNKQGKFFFKEGVLCDAAFESLTGEEAAIAMINSGEKPLFTLHPLTNTDIPRRINRRIMELLIEASRQKDAAANALNPAGAAP